MHYDLEVEKLDDSLLVQGIAAADAGMRVRPVPESISNSAGTGSVDAAICRWKAEDEAVPVKNDCVDLTPYVREDILLEFPQHPLCKPDCGGLPRKQVGKAKKTGGTGQTKQNSSAWAELNKLKF